MNNKIIDLHCDTITEIQAGINLLEKNSSGHLDINRLKEGNIGVQIFACFISSMLPQDKSWQEVEKLINLTIETCNQFSEYLELVITSKELEKVLTSNKTGIMIAVENGHAIENNLSNLEKMRRLGVSYLTLTHSKNLDWAASSGEEKCDFDGLTKFGEKVVNVMNEIGMIIDVSHVHESTFWDVAKISRRPFIASHSNASAICDISRNLTDDQIKAVADSGGMVGINFFPGFLDKDYYLKLVSRCGDLFSLFDEIELKYMDDPVKKSKGMKEFNFELSKRMKDTIVRINKIADHIEHIVNLVGDDFVGFGSDFDGVPALPVEISGCDGFSQIIQLLEQRNIPKKSINKITHKNFMRVLKENE